MTDTPTNEERAREIDKFLNIWMSNETEERRRFVRANVVAMIDATAERARQEERERCATIADHIAKCWYAGAYSSGSTARQVAKAIRSDGGNGDE